ncbi:hypothetical protein LCGC14_2781550, partial [marine sediment metagenome]
QCGDDCDSDSDCTDGSICCPSVNYPCARKNKCINPACKLNVGGICDSDDECTAVLSEGQGDCTLGGSSCGDGSTCNTTTGICGAAIEATTAPADTTDTTTLTELPQTGIDEDIIRIVGGMTLVIIGFVLYRKLNIKQ